MLSDCDQRAAIKHIRSNDWLHLIHVDIDIDSITLYNYMEWTGCPVPFYRGRQAYGQFYWYQFMINS